MADILITGKTEIFTREALLPLAEEYRVILAGETYLTEKLPNVQIYHTDPAEEKFGQLFDVYSFQAVYFVSGYVDGGEGLYGEDRKLEQTLLECSRSKVEKLVLLSTVESQNYVKNYGKSGIVTGKDYPNGYSFRAAQMEELCTYFAKKMKVQTVILWLPYLAGKLNDKNFLGTIFHHMYEKNKIFFPHHAEDRVDFLAYSDLAELLLRITEETEDESGSYFAVSGYRHTYGDLEELLRLTVPDAQICYENFADTIAWPDYPLELRRTYGFVPVVHMMEDVGVCYRRFIREVLAGNRKLSSRLAEWLLGKGKGLLQYLEVFVLFLLAELISSYTSEAVYFEFADVRLMYIVIVGTIHGMKMGIVAALLECIVLVWQYALMGMSGTLLFYNIENWIPFAIYLMAGSITGYIRNKKEEEIQFSKKEYALLRNKYIFLNDVYKGAIENKGEYKRQILGFKDSFGKIFDAVQKLDSQLPESIFLEGLKVMEDILENHSIAIYTLDKWQKFGRLAVCSNSQLLRLTKSIKLSDYQELYAQTLKGEVFKNTKLEEGLPMYACGVFRGDMMVLLITIQEAGVEQYNMHYMNIFRILCGLVQTSFLRALDYEELQAEDIYFPDTQVVYPERFRQLVNIQSDMKEAGVADFVLLRFEQTDKKFVSEALAGTIRATDTLGAGEDGRLYLLLVQMNRASFPVVEKRLVANGLNFELTEEVG
ncbi:MAG TPA: NAD-dependent epimerase/dehydratase family protein [Candidatus Merdisoma merdipullorum]|nr:NAD-dependent epimerase/dehydratase family protein [Candidatus Merdisoma merdipullorum]